MLITGPAFRRAVAVVVAACLVAGPFASTLAAHHVDDLDGAVKALSLEAAPTADASHGNASMVEADAKVFGAAHDPAQPQPSADHDCHGCSMVVPHAPAGSVALRLRSTPQAAPVRLSAGRSVPADIRPPRA
ncbi:hypothetical protein [Xanthobacter autotrophicus]|uniref:hypothetical protein n=1 Tax=Xanthobacter autotrophicus TaxID=280 RepID=UPI0024A7824E|nr:hypothetical protein [Xanthobacter autotrophicus]MDI4657450.1 hypothetical protein [Xanthobacter autotrophicus]